MKKLPRSFQKILWSYDINKMDIVKHKEEIITQVLNYGTWDNLKLLYKIYSEEDIREVVSHPHRGVWFEKVLDFWLKMFNITLTEDTYEKAIFRVLPHR